jgi:hypothetical protein
MIEMFQGFFSCFELLYEMSKEVDFNTRKQEGQTAAEIRSLSIYQRFLSTPKSTSDHALSPWASSDILHFDANEVLNKLDIGACLFWQIVEGLGSCDWFLPALKLLIFYLYVG